MQTSLRRAIMAILIGLPFAALCIGSAMLVMGMGHGWGAPLSFGGLSLLFFPLAIFRLRVVEISWRDDVTITLLIVLILLVVAVFAGPLLGGGVPIAAIHLQGWMLIAGMIAVYTAGHALLDRYRMSALWGDAVLLGVALLCNFAIYRDATGNASFGFRGNVFEILWLTIWAVWQVIALIAFVQHWRARKNKALPSA
jgi:hypothetical protein